MTPPLVGAALRRERAAGRPRRFCGEAMILGGASHPFRDRRPLPQESVSAWESPDNARLQKTICPRANLRPPSPSCTLLALAPTCTFLVNA
ncbi:protein of unknown function [Pseudomonas sp. JV551A1]|uniref:Uncharacterized protein n=1 Tax=Pseudomonas inefficax TaxID=2078786 RepID=A0AAQ1PC60_9PSED|nr:protein of unknown function [Pseudomonas sp. JV551A1]SPO61552.1 protein of unknown function [Pseudomonas inefficax]